MTTPNMRGSARRRAIVCAAFAAFFAAACGKAGVQTEDLTRLGREDAVQLAYETDKNGAIVPKGFAHPVTVGADTVAGILSMLTYSEHVFFKWRDRGEMFNETEVKKLAGPIASAFAQVGPDQWISFSVTSYKRDLLFKSRRLTTGWMWMEAGEKLNIVMGNFRLEMVNDIDPYDGDPRKRYQLATYRIDPTPQNLPPPIDENDEILKREHHNWTIVNVAAVREAQKAKTETPAASPPAPRDSAERLADLKRLFDQGLITQEEYDAKRREILDEL
ncbi:SHOCT domain-containing protein [bacterium]|nr:SHOCT domain-containing protein [bacterium]